MRATRKNARKGDFSLPPLVAVRESDRDGDAWELGGRRERDPPIFLGGMGTPFPGKSAPFSVQLNFKPNGESVSPIWAYIRAS
jgi:hypothetical protein